MAGAAESQTRRIQICLDADIPTSCKSRAAGSHDKIATYHPNIAHIEPSLILHQKLEAENGTRVWKASVVSQPRWGAGLNKPPAFLFAQFWTSGLERALVWAPCVRTTWDPPLMDHTNLVKPRSLEVSVLNWTRTRAGKDSRHHSKIKVILYPAQLGL